MRLHGVPAGRPSCLECWTRWPSGRRTRPRSTRSCRPTRDRPLRPGRRLRLARRLPRQRRREFERNRRRYSSLRWGPGSLPTTSRSCRPIRGSSTMSTSIPRACGAFPNRRPGQATPKHPRRDRLAHDEITGLGVLSGRGAGIEADAAMLMPPMSMRSRRVLGLELHGELPECATRHRPRG